MPNTVLSALRELTQLTALESRRLNYYHLTEEANETQYSSLSNITELVNEKE